MVLTLDAPLIKNSRLNFGVRLKGVPPDGLYFRNNRYGQAMMFTDHFSSRARGWLPSEDHPSDRAHFSLQIKEVENLEIVGLGRNNTVISAGIGSAFSTTLSSAETTPRKSVKL